MIYPEIENTPFEYRLALPSDLQEVIHIFRTARKQRMPYLPIVHTPEEDENYFSELIKKRIVRVAVQDGLRGFIAVEKGWINHLYVLPNSQGQGVGSHMLSEAMKKNSELQLWVFQMNTEARAFYESKGFVLAEETDGSLNEENEPDARYVWKK